MQKYLLFLTTLLTSISGSVIANEHNCPTGKYLYEPVILNDLENKQDIFMEVSTGDSIPMHIKKEVETNLGAINYSFTIKGGRGAQAASVDLIEACIQTGITLCSIDDFNEFKSRGVADSLGLFDIVKIYRNGKQLSAIAENEDDIPEYIFLDDSAATYFARGNGQGIMRLATQTINGDRKPLVDLYSWQRVRCGKSS